MNFAQNQTFQRQNYRETPLPKWEYEGYTFVNCDFSDSDISHIQFSDCEFIGCNLSMTKVVETKLQDVRCKDSKMLGIMFDVCNNFLLEFSFENCVLNFSSWYGMKIAKTKFKNCSLQEVNFTSTDLSEAIFENCDLSKALFDRTNLESADFRSSYGYSIDPENNTIKEARFSLAWTPGLLSKYDIIIE